MAKQPLCILCNETGTYNERWDSYYCAKCYVWLEPPCACEDDCEYVGRPDFPPVPANVVKPTRKKN